MGCCTRNYLHGAALNHERIFDMKQFQPTRHQQQAIEAKLNYFLGAEEYARLFTGFEILQFDRNILALSTFLNGVGAGSATSAESPKPGNPVRYGNGRKRFKHFLFALRPDFADLKLQQLISLNVPGKPAAISISRSKGGVCNTERSRPPAEDRAWNIGATSELITPVHQLVRNLNEIEIRISRMCGRYCIPCNGADSCCKIRP
jgi:hypothetical protein